MKIKTNREFSGVPKGTTGTIEKDGDLWKITWNLERGISGKPLVDWFNDKEKQLFLEVV